MLTVVERIVLVVCICIGEKFLVFAVVDFFLVHQTFVIVAIGLATYRFVVANVRFLYQGVVEVSLICGFIDVIVVRVSGYRVYEAVLRAVEEFGCTTFSVVVGSYGLLYLLSFCYVIF